MEENNKKVEKVDSLSEVEGARINLSQEDNVFTQPFTPIGKAKNFFMNVGNALLKGLLWVLDLILSMFQSLGMFFFNVFKYIGLGGVIVYKFFKRKVHQFKYNDLYGRLSFVIWGTGNIKHGQYVNGIMFLVFEIGYIILFALFGARSIFMLGTLGTVEASYGEGMFGEFIPGDNSIMILIYGLLWVLSVLVFFYIWNRAINSAYNCYRVMNYTKFANVYESSLETGKLIDSKVTEAFEKGLRKGKIKRLVKDDISKALLEHEKGFERDYRKYLFENTFHESYRDNERLLKLNRKLDRLVAKRDKFAAKNEHKYQIVLRPSEDPVEQKKYEKFEMAKNNYKLKLAGLDKKVKAQERKVFERVKMHADFVSIQLRRNRDKYGRFNDYYLHLSDLQLHEKFFTNYSDIVKYYEEEKVNFDKKNAENKQAGIDLKIQLEEKIKKINAQFDGALATKKEVQIELQHAKQELDAEVKAYKAAHANDPDLEEQVEAIKNRAFGRIQELSKRFADFPEDKAIKALRKEEIKEVKDSYKRDKKYLKTNYNEATYGKDATISEMMLRYDFAYEEATKLFSYVLYKDKETKQVRHLTREEAEERVNLIKADRAAYIEEHPDKFVGKPKTFKAQAKGLLNENFHITILGLPTLGIVLFTIVPLVFSILIAFTNYSKGHLPPLQLFTWNGIENFITLFAAQPGTTYAALPGAMVKTIGWTLIWTFIATFSNYFLGIILALVINKQSIKLKKLWRTVFVMTIAVPQFISLMSIGVMLKDSGAIGTLFQQLFGFKMGFASDGTNGALVSKIIIILVNIWVGIPYTILSTTGILLNIPKDLYESAKVDGANTFTQFTKITLPYILFVTGPYLITQFVGNINNFNVIYFLTGGGPAFPGAVLGLGQTDLLVTFIYKIITSASNPQYGIASAVGIVIFIICSFISIVMYNKSGAIKEEDQFQ